jgi:TLD
MERNIDNVKCVYNASKDGWSAINFHDVVDGKGSGIVVATTVYGRTFGGYNANGWRSAVN